MTVHRPAPEGIRPDYRTKLNYTLKLACMAWLLLPALIVSTVLDTRPSRWENFAYFAPLFTIVPLGVAVLWAARMADVPHDGMSWRYVWTRSALFNVVFIVGAVLPYFRYTYVHLGPTVVRVDRLTGAQCRWPPIGCASAPYDPVVNYDEQAGAWRIVPGVTVRDVGWK